MHLIENVVKQKDDWQLTWYFENSQYYLNSLDQESLKKILLLWPNSENSPFFDIKKAAIFAELGEFNEAKKITENALDKIRSHLLPNPLDYSVLSQESWAMVLHRNLTTMEKIHEGINPVEDRDRWERLAVYRCNPWPEIEKLQLLIQKPKSDPSQNNIKTWSFDPGRITVSHHFGMSSKFEEMLPSLSFLQLYERAALPMTCGNVDIFSDDVIRASKHIIRYYPISGFISMIRTGKEKEVKEWFDRPRLAVMSSDQINYLSNIFLRSFKQSLNHILKCRLPDKFNEPDFSYQNIKMLSEILSRFCYRFSNEQIGDLFDLTVQMYNSPIFYKDFSLYDCLSSLFKRTLFNMPDSMLFDKIPILLNLPIPTENEYNPSVVEHWIEPALLFEWKENMKMPSDFNRAKWDFPINNLIRITKEGTPESRKRAIARLEKINEIQCLNETERKLYAIALWNRIDPVSNLPSDIPFCRFSVLFMPESEKGIGKNKFRKYLSSAEIPRVIKREKRDDGKIVRSTGGISEFLEYTANWKGATLSFFSDSKSQKETLVDWDDSELLLLFKKIKNRWDEEKSDFKNEWKEIPSAFSFFRDNIETEISELINLIGVIILPKIIVIEDKECKKEIVSLIDEMDEYGACVLSILPLILLIDQSKLDSIAHKLRMGLLSSKEIEAESAIFGISVWIHYAENKKIPPIPQDIITELMNKVVTRRQPGLFNAIHAVNEIIEINPQFLDDEQNRSSICEALEYLLKDTEIPLDQSDEKREQYKSSVPFNGLPHFRELSTILAYTMFKYFESNKKTIPAILLNWKEVSQTDTLPEVRSAWG